ncbi:hypothetical protein DYBT9623_04636 [Dyadobacter sp. CECT 9623]|uniref:VapC45 PIN like domain-containing protein n=1 Tax=Dyadobacter linearis TaxID=2823330 RepID=A0ABN7RIA1_9BACT|nr:hypothetical protein [Dyadobacter sp. CECT 9623]CAG5073132.1 hypothetical protein DYBT9623_04636 [Dyadobacter sp. CECT 9623]
MIKIYIDENISPHIATGLNTLQSPLNDGFEVLSLESAFGRGVPDEEWLPKIGQQNAMIITQDLNIHRNRRQRELLEKYGVGVFFLTPPSKSGYEYWEMVEQIVKRWRDIKKLSKQKRPFAFRCTSRSTAFETW